MRRSLYFIAMLGFSAASTVGFGAETAPVKILATIAVQGSFAEVGPMLDARAGVPLKTEFSQSVPLLDRLSKGETADVVILTHAAVRDLAAKGRVKSQVDLLVSDVGIALADGAAKPPMKTTEDFAAFLKAVPSIAYSTQGTSGIYIDKLIGQLGLADIVKPKAVLVASGPTAERLLKGEVAAAIQQIPELKNAGAKNIMPLPDSIQLHTTFTAAVLNDTTRAKDADAVLKVLTSADAAAAYARSGTTPVAAGK